MMRISLLTLILLAAPAYAYVPTLPISVKINGSPGTQDSGYAVALDASGNVFVAGVLVNSTYDEWVAKYDSSLVLVSSATFDSGSHDGGYAMDLGPSGEVYVAGFSGSGIWVGKWDSSLVFQASATFTAGVNSQARGIDVDAAGNVFVAGAGNVSDSNDIWVARLGSSLNLVSSATFTGADSAGDFGWDVVADGANAVYVAGQVFNSQADSSDLWVGKFSYPLILQSSSTLKGSANQGDAALDVALDEAGGILVAGYVNQSGSYEDAWIARYGPDLVLRSSFTVNGAGNGWDRALGIAADGSGGIVVTGKMDMSPGGTSGTLAFPRGGGEPVSDDEDIWLAQFDSSDALIASATFTGSAGASGDSGQAVAVLGTSAIFMVGGVTESVGGQNLFLSKHLYHLPPPPAAPSGLAGTALDAGRVNWTWDDVAAEAGYRMLSDAGGDLSGALASGTTSWIETGLSTNAAYSRSVAAFNGNGASTSSAVTRYTLAAPPTSLALTAVSTSSVSIAWLANTNLGGTSYRTQIWTAGGSTTTLTVTVTSAAFTSLLSDTGYFMAVSALNGDDIAAASDIVLSTTTRSVAPAVSTGTVTSSETITTGGGTISVEPPSGSVRVEIPSGAFAEAVTVTVSTPSILPTAPGSGGATMTGTGVGVEVTLDKPLQPSPGRKIRIRIGFGNAGLTGDEGKLLIARYDPTRGVWVALFSWVDETNNFVEAETDHLSTFQIMLASPASTVSAAKAYPNPLRPALGHTAMTFSNLPAGAKIKIYTLAGEKIRELTANASGMASWDGRNSSGSNAASGVYFVRIESSGGGSKTIKVAIQR